MLRQGANSAVRFTSYATLKQLVQGNVSPGSPLPGWITFGIGATAGVITVCESTSLQPLGFSCTTSSSRTDDCFVILAMFLRLTGRYNHAARVSVFS